MNKLAVWRMLVAAAALALTAGCGPRKITVTGTVVNHQGIPLNGAMVTIGAYGEHWPAYADANGQFTVEDVEIPYDAWIFGMNALCYPYAEMVYQGLTRSDPVFTLQAVVNESGWAPPTPRTATITGQLSGDTVPQPAEHVALVAFSGQDCCSVASASVDGAFSWQPSWTGRNNVAGAMYALQWQQNAVTGLPETYKGFGTRGPLSFAYGASLTGQDIALAAVATSQVSGAATLPTGYTLLSRTMSLRIGEFGFIPIVTETPPATADFTYNVPQLPEAMIQVTLAAQNASGDVSSASWLLVPGYSGQSIALPEAVTLVQPADGAAGVGAGARFAWTPSACVHTLSITSSGTDVRTLTAMTAETSFSRAEWPFQDFEYSWTVTSNTFYSTVDQATSGPLSSGSEGVFGTAVSAAWDFTAP